MTNKYWAYLSISQYAATSIGNAAYIIGGYTDTNQPVGTIAKYEDNEWSSLDDLLEPRYGHAVITRTPYETMVVGGPGKYVEFILNDDEPFFQ